MFLQQFTNLSSPHYLPEVCIKVTIINLTVTKSGLEDQLLSDIIILRDPTSKIRELMVQIISNKSQLKAIDAGFLKLLFL